MGVIMLCMFKKLSVLLKIENLFLADILDFRK
jgi:hypothetical protein